MKDSFQDPPIAKSGAESKAGPSKWFAATSAKYNVTQRFFLARLERLAQLRRSEPQAFVRWQEVALNHALYSTYRDCVELGLNDEARTILQSANASKDDTGTAAPGFPASK